MSEFSLVVVDDDGEKHAETSSYPLIPIVSPDGEDIVYLQGDHDEPKTVRAMNPDGSNDRELLSIDPDSDWNWCDWSPDASQVVCLDDDDELHVAGADGSDQHTLTDGGMPTWFTVSE